MNADIILMDIKEEQSLKPNEKEKKEESKRTIILHTRNLLEEEEHILSQIFNHVVPFLYNYHCGKDANQLIAGGELLLVNISRLRENNLNWYKSQNTDGFNVIILANKIKRKEKKWLMGALGMISAIDATINCKEKLFSKCGALKVCSGLCCF